jgi:hypothetical protein
MKRITGSSETQVKPEQKTITHMPVYFTETEGITSALGTAHLVSGGLVGLTWHFNHTFRKRGYISMRV